MNSGHETVGLGDSFERLTYGARTGARTSYARSFGIGLESFHARSAATSTG